MLLELMEPLLTVISIFLAESQLNELVAVVLGWRKRCRMLFHMTEVISSIDVIYDSSSDGQ